MIGIYVGNMLINIIGLMMCLEFRLNGRCDILYSRDFIEFEFQRKQFKFTCEANFEN